MNRWGIGAAAAAVVVLLAGCGSGGEADSAAEDGRMVPGTPPATTPTPTPDPPMEGALGDSYVNEAVEVTVEDYNSHVTTAASDETWQAALVKLCILRENSYVSPTPWTLVDSEWGRWGPAGSYYDDAPKPMYPTFDTPVAVGECVRGWILFEATADVDVVEIRYSSDSAKATWKIPA